MYITLYSLYTLIVILITHFHISGLLYPRHLVLGCSNCRLTYFRLFRTSEQDLSQKLDYSVREHIQWAFPLQTKNIWTMLRRIWDWTEESKNSEYPRNYPEFSKRKKNKSFANEDAIRGKLVKRMFFFYVPTFVLSSWLWTKDEMKHHCGFLAWMKIYLGPFCQLINHCSSGYWNYRRNKFKMYSSTHIYESSGLLAVLFEVSFSQQ